jgi:hypothetical protein
MCTRGVRRSTRIRRREYSSKKEGDHAAAAVILRGSRL